MHGHNQILASRDSLGYVYRCGCGTIHFAVGPADLKFSPEGFVEFFEMLGEAVARMQLEGEELDIAQLALDAAKLKVN